MKSRSPVVGIRKRGDEFIVETEAGEEYTARVVISNADPVLTLGELVDQEIVPSEMQQKVEQLRPSLGAFFAYVGTDLDLPSLGITDGNIHHSDDLDLNKIYETLHSPTPSETVPWFFLTSPSVKDPDGGHAPPNHHVVELFTFIDYGVFEKWAEFPSMERGREYDRFKEQMGRRLLKGAERYIPGLSDHLKCVDYATPLTNEYWVNAVGGGCYGPEQTPDQVGPGRFTSFTAGIEGLFLVGAGTLGGGIMACVASGVFAGGKATSYLGLRS